MGTEKLNVTARAAGFAMACDDAATAPVAAASQQPSGQTATPAHVRTATSTALVPVKQAKTGFNWPILGWGFWKTA